MLLRELEARTTSRTTCRSRTSLLLAWFLPTSRAFGVPMPSPQWTARRPDPHAARRDRHLEARAGLLIDERSSSATARRWRSSGLLNLLHGGRSCCRWCCSGCRARRLLKLDEPLAQRVEIRVEMTAMDWLESQAYVSHRLRLAVPRARCSRPTRSRRCSLVLRRAARAEHTGRQRALRGLPHRDRPVDSPVVQARRRASGSCACRPTPCRASAAAAPAPTSWRRPR